MRESSHVIQVNEIVTKFFYLPVTNVQRLKKGVVLLMLDYCEVLDDEVEINNCFSLYK